MSARSETWELTHHLNESGIEANFDQANTLRRAQLTLRRWGELECGDGNGAVERDEETGKTYWLNAMTSKRWPTPDRETGALRRVAAVCKALGCHFYYQGDPRGCALYVSREPLDG